MTHMKRMLPLFLAESFSITYERWPRMENTYPRQKM